MKMLNNEAQSVGARSALISWAPRVSREKILQLYQEVADGINDQELIDDVAYSFSYRCSDMVRFTEGRFACPQCHEELPYPHTRGNDLHCGTCGWQMPWKEHSKTYQNKQLTVNTDAPRRFMHDLRECKSPQEKVILIDSLIHTCHESIRRGIKYYTRPLAVNLIEGTMSQVIAFLENLPYGPGSSPEMSQQLAGWRKQCLSIVSELSLERDEVTRLVDSMPDSLLAEIEAMIKQKHRQKAAARLAVFREYRTNLKVLRGTTAQQMVRIIEKRIKTRAQAPI